MSVVTANNSIQNRSPPATERGKFPKPSAIADEILEGDSKIEQSIEQLEVESVDADFDDEQINDAVASGSGHKMLEHYTRANNIDEMFKDEEEDE